MKAGPDEWMFIWVMAGIIFISVYLGYRIGQHAENIRRFKEILRRVEDSNCGICRCGNVIRKYIGELMPWLGMEK